MLRANQAVYVCPPYTEQGLTPRRPPICARHNVHLEPYMDLMHTPFANQLSITYNWSDQCNGATWVYLLYIFTSNLSIFFSDLWNVSCHSCLTDIWRRVNIFHPENVPIALQYLRTFLWFSNFVRPHLCATTGGWAKDGLDHRLQLLAATFYHLQSPQLFPL